MSRKSIGSEKRWPLDLAFRDAAEREIYNLQARLSSDPDERAEILKRIEEHKAKLAETKARSRAS